MTLQYSIGIGFDGGSTVKATCRLWNGKITKYGTATATLSIPDSITVNADLAWGYGSTTIDVTAKIGTTSYTKALSISGTVNATGVASNAHRNVVNQVTNYFNAYNTSPGSTAIPTNFTISGGSANGGAGTITMTHSTYDITQEVTVSEGSVECVTKTEGVAAITTTKTVTMTKGTPMASGGKAAVQIGGTKAGDIDITDWWTGGYDAADAASVAVQGTPGATATSIFVTVTRGDGTAHSNLSLNVSTFREAVYNKGWNDAVDAMNSKTCYTGGTAYSKLYTKSGETYTDRGAGRTGLTETTLYEKPSKK